MEQGKFYKTYDIYYVYLLYKESYFTYICVLRYYGSTVEKSSQHVHTFRGQRLRAES